MAATAASRHTSIPRWRRGAPSARRSPSPLDCLPWKVNYLPEKIYSRHAATTRTTPSTSSTSGPPSRARARRESRARHRPAAPRRPGPDDGAREGLQRARPRRGRLRRARDPAAHRRALRADADRAHGPDDGDVRRSDASGSTGSRVPGSSSGASPSGDRRSRIVALTEKGRELIDRAAPEHFANEARLLEPLTLRRARDARPPARQARGVPGGLTAAAVAAGRPDARSRIGLRCASMTVTTLVLLGVAALLVGFAKTAIGGRREHRHRDLRARPADQGVDGRDPPAAARRRRRRGVALPPRRRPRTAQAPHPRRAARPRTRRPLPRLGRRHDAASGHRRTAARPRGAAARPDLALPRHGPGGRRRGRPRSARVRPPASRR